MPAKKIIKRGNKTAKKEQKIEWVETDEVVAPITPDTLYMVTLDVEDTQFLLVYKDTKICVCMDIADGHETIMIPTPEFDKREWYYEYMSNGKIKRNTTKITVLKQGA